VKQSARGFSVRQDQLQYLPRGVDYTSVVQLLPGTNVEGRLGGISVDGASAAENRFIIDGIDTSSPVLGLPSQFVNVEDVEEVQVKSSGYSAEYGGTTGGVVNVLTKSGTNAWHGELRFALNDDVLDAGPRPELRRKLTVVNEAEYITYAEDPYVTLEPGFSVGGPIRRNLAWFFAGYQPIVTHRERTVTFALGQDTQTFGQDVARHLFTGSQTLQLGARLRTRASLNAAPTITRGVLPVKAGTDSPTSSFDVDTTEPNWTLSGNVDVLAAPTVFLSGRVGYTLRDIRNTGVRDDPVYGFQATNIGFLDVPPELQRVTGFVTNSVYFEYVKARASRLAAQVDATWYVHRWGEHTLKGGIQADWSADDVDSGFKANLVLLLWNRNLNGVRGKYGLYTVRSNTLEPRRGFLVVGSGSGHTAGLFVQDAWRIGKRLTVNAGIRSEREVVPEFARSLAGQAAIDLGFGDKLAPRVGAAYDVRGDGRWKLYGSWGVFYDVFKYYAAMQFGSADQIVYTFTLDTYDWPNLLGNPACPPACPGTLLQQVTKSGSAVPVDPGLQPMRSQEAVVGLEHQWKPNLVVAARYVHKQLDRAVDDIAALDADLNAVYTVGNPGSGLARFAYTGVPLPEAVRDYDAIEVSARRPLTGRWAFSGSYIWSRLYGNYSGLTHSDESGRVAPNFGRVYDNPFVMFDEQARPVLGVLGTDRPHQLKGTLVYQAPFRLTVGAYQFVASGVPVTRETWVVPGALYPIMYAGRMSDGRTPVLWQTDLYVQQDIRLWRDTRLSVGLNVTNLFNQDTATSKYVVQNEQGFATALTAADFFGGRFDAQQYMAQQGIRTDARFLLPDGFQAPRSARVQVKWAF
jgi:hypothetical protein